MKPKLMILGAGTCQIPIIKKARGMGFYTIAVSMSGNYAGFSEADKSYEIDVREKEDVLRAANQENIRGILTDQTDITVPTVAYVAEKLGLPGIGYDCALRFTNKFRMRQSCDEIGVPGPVHYHASTWETACEYVEKLGFPLVVKPVDSQGSRGVTKVNSYAELEKKVVHALGYSPSNTVILEEYIPDSKEVVVQGFAANGRFVNLAVGDRYYFDLPDTFIPKQTLFPSLLPEALQQKILKINDHLIRSFAPKFGITHSEYLVVPDTGKIHLVETAIRGGGVFISSDLVPIACGINVMELLIKCATGIKNVHLTESKKENHASGYLCFYLPEGVIRRVEGIEQLKTLPGIEKTFLDDIQIGRKIGPLRDKTMRLGPILISGTDRKGLHETILNVQNALNIEVETASGIEGIQW